jgi:arsenite-transporting ATPase
MKSKIVEINKQFKDPERTTFIAVCIPEFLSLYETERLAIELAKFEIDIHNIVINQVVFPEADQPCRKCLARRKMQDKYIT